MNEISHVDFVISIIVAMFAGFAIGIERQLKHKNAGLKTNALVAVGAAIFVNISLRFMYMEDVDVSRIIGQIVVGVGFLGAGVIIERKEGVSGLATAASIWCSASLGCLSALKMYYELIAATVIIVMINIIFGKLNHYINNKNKDCQND